jgi:hypothetical protein
MISGCHIPRSTHFISAALLARNADSAAPLLGCCVRQRPDADVLPCLNLALTHSMETLMYIGGILGTILVICLIVWVIRRV